MMSTCHGSFRGEWSHSIWLRTAMHWKEIKSVSLKALRLTFKNNFIDLSFLVWESFFRIILFLPSNTKKSKILLSTYLYHLYTKGIVCSSSCYYCGLILSAFKVDVDQCYYKLTYEIGNKLIGSIAGLNTYYDHLHA